MEWRWGIVLSAIFGGGVCFSDGILLVRFGVIQVTDVLADRTLDFVTSLDRAAATDVVLLEATGRGDREALAQLYARHAPWLILRLGRKCPDAGIVDEVVQDTFLAVWRNARQWDSRGEVAAWIWGIAVRRLIDALRRRPSIGVSLDQLPDGAGIPEPSAEDQVLMGGEYGDVALALERLPPDLYAVVRATVVDGLTTREAAQLLGIPVGTVKTRMMRARTILRKELT